MNLPAFSLTYVLTLFIYNHTLKVRVTRGHSLAGLFFHPTDQLRPSHEEFEGLSTQQWAAEAGLGFQSNSQLYSVRQQYYKLIVSHARMAESPQLSTKLRGQRPLPR